MEIKMQYGKKELCETLSFLVGEEAPLMADKLLGAFGSVREIFFAEEAEIIRVTGNKKIALPLKLAASLQSRRITDSFAFLKKHTEEEIKEYFEALFFGFTSERVYLMSLDDADRVIDCRAVGEGTVNAAGVLPRVLLEIALSCGASSVILAHNHPRGDASASAEDINLSISLYEMFFDGGIKLSEHYIVSANECRAMKLKELVAF